jgi:peptide/nickel transport system substrate-binding protein
MTGGGRRGPRARAGVLRRFLPRALAWPLLLGAVVCATALSPAQAQAKDKDRLIVGMQLEPPVLDPTVNPAAAISEALYGNLFEGLVQFARDGSVLPCLAESWEISSDGLS